MLVLCLCKSKLSASHICQSSQRLPLQKKAGNQSEVTNRWACVQEGDCFKFVTTLTHAIVSRTSRAKGTCQSKSCRCCANHTCETSFSVRPNDDQAIENKIKREDTDPTTILEGSRFVTVLFLRLHPEKHAVLSNTDRQAWDITQQRERGKSDTEELRRTGWRSEKESASGIATEHRKADKF